MYLLSSDTYHLSKNLQYPDHICNFIRRSNKLPSWQVSDTQSNPAQLPLLGRITDLKDNKRQGNLTPPWVD